MLSWGNQLYTPSMGLRWTCHQPLNPGDGIRLRGGTIPKLSPMTRVGLTQVEPMTRISLTQVKPMTGSDVGLTQAE